MQAGINQLIRQRNWPLSFFTALLKHDGWIKVPLPGNAGDQLTTTSTFQSVSASPESAVIFTMQWIKHLRFCQPNIFDCKSNKHISFVCVYCTINRSCSTILIESFQGFVPLFYSICISLVSIMFLEYKCARKETLKTKMSWRVKQVWRYCSSNSQRLCWHSGDSDKLIGCSSVIRSNWHYPVSDHKSSPVHTSLLLSHYLIHLLH